MADWSEYGSWTGNGIRREVFYFSSGGVELYGSLYGSTAPTRPLGVVICGSWGIEAEQADPLAHVLANEIARRGGTGLTFHYPGFGDSYGDMSDLTISDLAASAVAATAAGAERSNASEWIFAGFSFGASVACLAQSIVDAPGLLLMQPALRPSAYLARLTARARRGASDGAGKPMAFGYPIPEHATEDDDAVATALSRFAGPGAAIRYERPADPLPVTLPASVEQIELPGSWRFGGRHQPGMAAAAARWINGCPVAVAEAR